MKLLPWPGTRSGDTPSGKGSGIHLRGPSCHHFRAVGPEEEDADADTDTDSRALLRIRNA